MKRPFTTSKSFFEWGIADICAVLGITIDPAYASFTDNILGSIVPGKRADYVVFSQDIMEVPADHVLKTKVLATVMDGKAVYGAL